MRKAILKLLGSKKEGSKISKMLYNHYLENFEFNIVKEKYKNIIKNSNNLRILYEN